ncbi:hypothetical protein BK120_30190 [Paenibacillus sp. FSL A5-0031]|uniref:hypothetical protein n=1 Tax=Paenibacillus sp. FSL A5-0031 TaxID=1920420 RepID=UPI00096EAA3A|nr:hypothetical protein [Paenibacillus sp. FSL A5-0031]OME75936.1 hypothetical protein BK120_30190 [Paenibacillus sp. FSL A5-0031]
MEKFQVRGFLFDGTEVQEDVQAVDERSALSLIRKKHGQLRKGYDIYTTKLIVELGDFPDKKMETAHLKNLEVKEVMRIAAAIRENTVTSAEYGQFKIQFRNMVRSALVSYWNDVADVPRSDKEDEIYRYIATEFIPRVDLEKGFYRYIRINVISRIRRDWRRIKFVNGNNDKNRVDAIREYLSLQNTNEQRDPEQLRESLKRMAITINKQEIKLSLELKRLYYGLVVQTRLHKAALKSDRQREAIEQCYGKDPVTEGQQALISGSTQQNVHKNKSRGEKNILRFLSKNFENRLKTVVFFVSCWGTNFISIHIL